MQLYINVASNKMTCKTQCHFIISSEINIINGNKSFTSMTNIILHSKGAFTNFKTTFSHVIVYA